MILKPFTLKPTPHDIPVVPGLDVGCNSFLDNKSYPSLTLKFSENKKTNLEKIEDIELLRALEIGLKIKTIRLTGDSFSIDVHQDYLDAIKKFKTDKFLKLYK